MKKKNFLKLVLQYSFLFLMFFSLIIFLFYKQNKGFVWINVSYDGLDQHLVNLHLLKQFITNLLNGHFITFIWNIGYGMDMFANYNYYIFGDFISYISYFFPSEKLDILYYVLVVLRVYLAGLSFLFYTKYKKFDYWPSLMGVIIYLFSFYIFFSMARHPFFINSMILFPIILISIDEIILKNKKSFFILMVAILFFTSFYFGYMLSIILAIYGIILAFHNYDRRKAFQVLLRTFLCAILGVLMSMVTLLPTIDAFFSSGRSGMSVYFYPLYYYSNLVGSIIRTKNTGYWSIIGISSISLVCLPVFIKNYKKNKILAIFLGCLLVPLLIPFVGTIFDCMSFPNNRWIFVLVFLLAIICTIVLNEKYIIDYKKIGIGIGIYALLLFILYGFDIQWVLSIILGFLFLLIMKKRESLKKKYNYLLMILLIVNIFINIIYTFDSNYDNYVKEFASFDANNLYQNNNDEIKYLNKAIEYIKSIDDGFYNIMVYPNVLSNVSIMNNYNSTSYFYSLVSNNYYRLAKDLENNSLSINSEIKHFNYRPMINNLLNNRYLITNNKDYIPYGYRLIKNYANDTYVYQNALKTSFSHFYIYGISNDEYEALSPIDKEYSLLVSSIGDNYKNDSKNIKTSLSYQTNLSINNNHLDFVDDNKTLSLTFDSDNSGELYLYIKNLQKQKKNLFDKSNFSVDVKMNDLVFHESFDNKYFNTYYYENNDLLVNLGYYNNIHSSLDIIFSDLGNYSFDKIELLMVDMSKMEDIMNNLYVSESDFKFEDNSLTFNIQVKEPGLLSFTTNYHKNWKIYVDNELVDSRIVNKVFLGCNITNGYHQIKLVYENKLIKTGMVISIIGVGIFALIIIKEKKKVKK